MSVKLLFKLIQHSVQEFLINRFTALVTLIFGLLFFSLEIIAGFVFFNHTETILGFTQTDYMLLIANATTVSFLYQTLFVVSHESLADAIIEGELDYTLIRPVSSLMFYALYRIDIPSFINLGIALAVQIYFTLYYTLSALDSFVYVCSILLSTYLVFLLNHLAVCVSFWIEKAGAIQGVPEYLVEFASRPLVVYPNVVRFIFTWLLPLVIGINLPVLIVKQQAYMYGLIALVLVNILGTLLLKSVWRRGIAHYVSAN